MAKRIDKLTDAQRARMDEWADRWIEVGLRTGPADRRLLDGRLQRPGRVQVAGELGAVDLHGRGLLDP